MSLIKHNERGQATVETLIAMLALIPLFIAIPHIGKLLDTKHTNIRSAKNTVFRKLVTGTNDSDNIPGNAWLTHRGSPLTSPSGTVRRLSSVTPNIERGSGMDILLNGSLPLPERVVLDIENGGITTVQTSITAKNLPPIAPSGSFTSINTTGETIEFISRLALLTGTFIPTSETEITSTLSDLTLEESLDISVKPGCILAPFSPNARDCLQTEIESESSVVLDRYIDKENKRGN